MNHNSECRPKKPKVENKSVNKVICTALTTGFFFAS